MSSHSRENRDSDTGTSCPDVQASATSLSFRPRMNLRGCCWRKQDAFRTRRTLSGRKRRHWLAQGRKRSASEGTWGRYWRSSRRNLTGEALGYGATKSCCAAQGGKAVG